MNSVYNKVYLNHISISLFLLGTDIPSFYSYETIVELLSKLTYLHLPFIII